jgi:isopenicillin-N epimerase
MTNRDISPYAHHWTLDPDVDFLNHGSYGSCPRVVLELQAELRARLERQPVHFFGRELAPLLDRARAELAAFVGADESSLVFVTNATAAVNTVLRSLEPQLGPHAELLTTNHTYAACRNALDVVAERCGARVVVADVPFPLTSSDQVVDAVLAACTAKTKLALLDHVSSPTGLVFPIERIIPALRARGVQVLIDGAHAPGMLPLDLRALGADYYTGNCHKWLCAPKSSALLYVAPEHCAEVRPLVISHGASAATESRSRYWLEFDWTGTSDPTPQLCVPAAIAFLRSLDGASNTASLTAHYAANRALALQARTILCDALGSAPPCPDSMIGSLAALPLPDGSPFTLHDALIDQAHFEVHTSQWPAEPQRLMRVSAQRYNHASQYERLGRALRALL